ncbi:MAG TPA: NAD(P)/FAD-dependent oxidoreductase [Gammaproteobacteria bacterium]|mgnify:CR=1 FL=1|nr:NAD(P)/FAD-dependent oxidoreductase [Gammaproteobacteria bacterium]
MIDTKTGARGAPAPLKLDAAVIGAGVAGLYQVYQLRKLGLSVKGFDTASNVGGTWYWNRYPGAKFDSECYIYQYLFDEDLYKDWSWSERFPGQPEIERWMNYVADRLDLRKDFQFETTIKSAHYDEATGRWTLTTDRGQLIDTQFVISCCGMLSAPLERVFEGQESFKGRLFHTGRWPKEALDFSDQRVGVVGVGATGIQVIQTIAPRTKELTVFVRTPQYISPMVNPSYGPQEATAYKARFEELKSTLPHTFSGFEFEFPTGAWRDLTPAERRQRMEDNWAWGSLKLWLATCPELFTDPEVNEEVSEFVREKMRERLKDPELCELLIPTDYGFGTHRVPLESNYLEVYHRPNVRAVSVKQNPIERVVPEGVRLADGTVYELDVLILATGFDAGSGALTRIDVRGRGGRALKDDWGRDIRTAYGLQIHGYPNLFTTGAPLAPSAALCNMTTCLQQQTEWITAFIAHLRQQGKQIAEASKELEDHWVAHHDEVANATLVTKTNSWYMGSNVEGKPRRLLSYIGGVGQYRQKCEELAARQYAGFELR